MIRALAILSDPRERQERTAALSDAGVSVTAFGSVERGLASLPDGDPDVVVTEFELPGLSGSAAVTSLLEAAPSAAVVVLAREPATPVMLAAFGAGAAGVVVHDSEPSVLVEAARAVAAGGVFVDPRLAGTLVALAAKGRQAKGPYDLTPQELRVLEHLAHGLTNPEIAAELVLATETIKSHVRSVMRKVGIHTRAELARFASERGLV